MPELPDVELFKRRLEQGALHRRVKTAVVSDRRILGKADARQFAQHLTGARLEEARRHGKHLLVRLDKGGWLAMHFGMNGGLECFDALKDDPPYDRVRLDFAEGGHLAYTNPRMLGRVGMVDDAAAFVAAEGIGPDVLDPAFDLGAFKAALAGRPREIKAALMDQAVMAGIGNIYSDEILFQARLHPRSRTDRLTDAMIRDLYRKTGSVLRTAVARGAGSEQLQDKLPSSYIIPNRRQGARCPRCRKALKLEKIGGRTSYTCPYCQRRPLGTRSSAHPS